MLLNHLILLRLGEYLKLDGLFYICVSANDNIRMQSLEARKNYRNSFVCAVKIFKDEGLFTLWSGAAPRLARLILSGGIVFTMLVALKCTLCVYLLLTHCRYEKTMEVLDTLDPQRKYI